MLIRRSDNDNWAVPGGAIDLGESMVQAAVRETREETGIDCEITGLVGIYTDPKHVILYTSNGEARQEFSILLTGVATGGQPTPSSESSEVRWVPRADVAGYQMDRSMRHADRALPGRRSGRRISGELASAWFTRRVVRACGRGPGRRPGGSAGWRGGSTG